LKAAAITRDTATVRRSAWTTPLLAIAIAGAWPTTAPAQGGIGALGRPTFLPGVRAAATYSDNILLAPDGQEDSDWLLEVTPYVTAQSNTPRARYNVRYELRNLWQVGSGDTALARHALNGAGSFALVDDRLWLDLAGYMGNVNDSITGPLSADPGGSLVNTARVRRFSASPWYRDRFSDLASYQLRYTIAHTGGDAGFALAQVDQRAQANVEGLEDGSSPWNWRWYGDFQNTQFENDITRNRRASGAALVFRVVPELRVFGTADYEQIDYVFNEDGEDSGWGPGVGFDWAPNARTSVGAYASERYYGTIGNARATYSTGSSTMGLQFSRSMLTAADTSLLLFDPVAITGGQFGAPVTDPTMGSLIDSGLVSPTGTALTQGLVTDAAVLDRRLLAFYGLRGVRNSLTLSGWLSKRRTAADATTAAAGNAFTGELREHGAGIAFLHQLSTRSSIDVRLDGRISEPATGGFETRLATLRIAYLTRLTTDTRAFLGFRRAHQSGEGTSVTYDENAVFAGIDMQFR